MDQKLGILKPVVFIGFMAVGKSSTGRKLATLTGWKFLDTDTLVEEMMGCTVPEIFARHGEPKLRSLETEALQYCLAQERAVIATGGGIVESEENCREMYARGKVFWLDALFEDAKRWAEEDKKNERPLFKDEAVAIARYTKRKPIYDRWSHVRLDARRGSVFNAGRAHEACRLLV